jgi:3-phosphoshikimate 1-carboxyvinyltransferase
MGARIETEDGHAPLTVHGRDLHGITYEMPVASAQVKSAILLAGLYANSSTTVHQTGPARDHTERMLSAMGAKIATDGCSLTVSHSELSPLSISIPGDFSSAAFPIVAATIVRGSNITLREVGINPTRTGLLAVLSAMGASVAVEGFRNAGNEPVADLRVQSANLHAVEIDGDTVVRMIDEFPILAVAATQAEGTTIVRDAAELRVKETDRIATVAEELRKLGARIEPTPDGYVVQGLTPLHGAAVSSHGDHRLAMALAVAGLVADGTTQIDDIGCANDSFPGFVGLMRAVGGQYD